MRVKQISRVPMINHNIGARSLQLVDDRHNQLNKTIADSIYNNVNYSAGLYVDHRQEPQQDIKGNDALLTMRTSVFNTALMVMKRILLRIWSLTKNSIYFLWAVLKFMYSALEFIVLFIKFLFTQKHWSN
jgi:hypothetical protein